MQAARARAASRARNLRADFARQVSESRRANALSSSRRNVSSRRKSLGPDDERVCAPPGPRRRAKGTRANLLRSDAPGEADEGVLYTVKVTRRSDMLDGAAGGEQYEVIKNRGGCGGGWTGRCLAGSLGLWIDLPCAEDVDSYLYRPSYIMQRYINWTFYASFFSVFISFFVVFIALCFLFTGFLAWAGEIQPECIVVSGEHFGTNPDTKFIDAFALSWTTFTTVGYGNVYTTTGTDFEEAETRQCSAVVFLCTLEAFFGLIYAGMCTAILFGKVNRIQSHAHLTFANAVCLQYEDADLDETEVDDDLSDSDCEGSDCDFDNENRNGEASPQATSMVKSVNFGGQFSETKSVRTRMAPQATSMVKSVNFGGQFSETKSVRTRMARVLGPTFKEQFKGCPVLKFQVVNDLCNKAGGEIIDGIMKVVGIKMKYRKEKISHSQYVRVSLVDIEHPFFGRVWHGVHILDRNSSLLTDSARRRIAENRGRWPEKWFESPKSIRRKLDFHYLVVTVAGVSNLSASSVHAYKRYKVEDVIIGFDFAPLVYENEHKGRLEVDLKLVNVVREQHKGHGEDPNARATDKDNDGLRVSGGGTPSVFRKSLTESKHRESK